MTNILQQLLYCFTWSSNWMFLPINSISLSLNPWIFYHPLDNLFPSFNRFFVLFWMLWILVMVCKTGHVPHASRITTWGTLFRERPFSVSKEWVRSWSRVFLIIYHKTFAKKLQVVRPKSHGEGEKEQVNHIFQKVMSLNAYVIL